MLLFAAVRCPLLADTVEKGLSMRPARNNRIMGADFLNQSCVFDVHLESMLLRAPLKILFQQYLPKADIDTGVFLRFLDERDALPLAQLVVGSTGNSDRSPIVSFDHDS